MKNLRDHTVVQDLLVRSRHHLHAAVMSLGRLSRAPFSGFLTVLVMAIALALPAGLYVMLENFHALEEGWRTGAQISLFLKKTVTESEAKLFARHLRTQENINKVDYLSRDAALADFRQLSGFDAALDLLPENPFPHVIIVYPNTDQLTPEKIDGLVAKYRQMPLVDKAQLDTEWLTKLASLVKLGHTLAMVVGGFVGVAVLLIMTNTIRLLINTRLEEIEVMNLVGATNRFIRRPFLYSGLWLGLAAGFLAWFLLKIMSFILYTPLNEVIILYQSSFEANLLSATLFFQLLMIGLLLGWLGARIAVHQHLMRLERRMSER